MDKNTSNEPAFPCPDTERNFFQGGMSLRDYFAAQAMQAYVSHLSRVNGEVCCYYKEVSEESYKIADWMLDKRAEGRQ